MGNLKGVAKGQDYRQKLVTTADIPRLKNDGYRVLDLHLHTSASYDVLPSSVVHPQYMYNHMSSTGWDYVVFTDHDTCEGYNAVTGPAEHLISGVEIKIKPDRIGRYENAHTLHINVYCLNHRQFTDLETLAASRDFYAFKAYLEEAGLPYQLNHPTWTEVDDNPDWRYLPDIVKEFEVIEAINHKRPQRHNLIALNHLAGAFGKGITGGSDNHTGQPLMATLCKGDSFEEVWQNIKAGNALVLQQTNQLPINKGDIISRVDQIKELSIYLEQQVQFVNRLGDDLDKWVSRIVKLFNTSPRLMKHIHCAALKGFAHLAGNLIIRHVYLNQQDRFANSIEIALGD